MGAGPKVRGIHAIYLESLCDTKQISLGGFNPGVALKSSAIAATSWDSPSAGLQLRLFWQDGYGLLRGYKWSGSWESTGYINSVPVGTHSSATNWNAGSSIQLYYQADDGSISEESINNLTTTVLRSE
jgi:hypothetical protein